MSLPTLFRAVAFYGSMLLVGISAFALNLFSLVVAWLPTGSISEGFFQRVIHRHAALSFRWLAMLGVIHVEYRKWQQVDGEGAVLVANHPGLLDAFYLLACTRRGFCVFKNAIRGNPVIGSIAARAGYLSNDRGVELVRGATEKIAAGASLIIFPEGTRTRGGTIGRLRPGFALIARRANAPVQLVRISSDTALFTKQRAWWKLPHLPARIVVEGGPRLDAAAYASTEALVAEVDNWFRGRSESCVQLTPPIARPLTVS